MASTVPYVQNPAWADGSGGGTPVTAAKLNTIEQGITDAHLQPCVHVYNNAAISIPNNTATKLTFNSERFDQAGGAAAAHHSTVTNTSRLTCLYAGVYQITGQVDWSANSTGFRYLDIMLNNTTILAVETRSATAGSISSRMSLTTLYALAVNDYVELRAQHDSGAALNVAAGSNYSPDFMMVRVG